MTAATQRPSTTPPATTAQAPQIEAAAKTLDDHYGPAVGEYAAREAELERRDVDPPTERAIAARHDPDLHPALEDRLGPRPSSLAERDAWDTAAARQLTAGELPRTRNPEPGAPDAAPTREWTLPEPPELPTPQPDIGFDLDL